MNPINIPVLASRSITVVKDRIERGYPAVSPFLKDAPQFLWAAAAQEAPYVDGLRWQADSARNQGGTAREGLLNKSDATHPALGSKFPLLR